MAQRELALAASSAQPVQEQTYWQAVRSKFLRDRLAVFGLVLLLLIVAGALSAGWISDNVLGYNPLKTNLRARNDPPTWAEQSWPFFQQFTRTCQRDSGCDWSLWGPISSEAWAGLGRCLSAEAGQCHWMGTDDAGRDVLARGLFGGRISLRIGLFVTLVSLTLGVVMGLVSGYYATTWIDDIVNALIMLIDSIPLLFLLIILSRIFTPGPLGLSLLLGAFGWVGISVYIRGQIFSVRERDYILSSRAIGATPWRIMFRHILPNVSSVVIVLAVFGAAGAIIAEAGLSYLGVGIGPPLPSWGNMMQGSLGNFTDAPWLVIAPGFFIFLTTLSIYLIGDGLRDALDPWVKQ